MKYIFPAIFSFEPNTAETYNVYFPDLPGCNTFGDSLREAFDMAEDALSLVLWSKEEDGETIPSPTPMKDIKVKGSDFVNLIAADTVEYGKVMMKSVRKNVTIPAWLNRSAEAANINFSQTLQEALTQKLSVDK